jgi:16S rRNA (guanine527-N7)-methyltransferase
MIQTNTLKKNLIAALPAFETSVDDAQADQLIDYLTLLQKWNRAFNLTAINDPAKMLTHHILDSLATAEFLPGKDILDVGTGAGIPGIIYAICFPDKHFTLLDSNGKKTRFLTQCAHSLHLKNITVIHSRIEDYTPNKTFNTICARALCTLHLLVTRCAHLTDIQTTFFALKGQLNEDELEEAASTHTLKIQEIQIPTLPDTRHIIYLNQKV